MFVLCECVFFEFTYMHLKGMLLCGVLRNGMCFVFLVKCVDVCRKRGIRAYKFAFVKIGIQMYWVLVQKVSFFFAYKSRLWE